MCFSDGEQANLIDVERHHASGISSFKFGTEHYASC